FAHFRRSECPECSFILDDVKEASSEFVALPFERSCGINDTCPTNAPGFWRSPMVESPCEPHNDATSRDPDVGLATTRRVAIRIRPYYDATSRESHRAAMPDSSRGVERSEDPRFIGFFTISIAQRCQNLHPRTRRCAARGNGSITPRSGRTLA